ncbi:MAG: hypothetical protein C4547_13970 [Phycisphaerales bacterium]|nr:MAG: hypothetical protein C4547_13970 [Phycisphaerales bacterium]
MSTKPRTVHSAPRKKFARQHRNNPNNNTANVPKKIPLHLKLFWLDPDPAKKDTPHPFPEGFPVRVIQPPSDQVPDDRPIQDVKLDKNGYVKVDVVRLKHEATLEFGIDVAAYVASASADAKLKEGEAKEQWVLGKDTERLNDLTNRGFFVFKAPRGRTHSKAKADPPGEKDPFWAPINSTWNVGKQAPCYDKEKKKFEFTGKANSIGTVDAPVELVLDPCWQYVKFEYFDRYYGHTDHSHKPISVPKLLIEGYRDRATQPKSAKQEKSDESKKPDTHCLWFLDPAGDVKKRVQCVPWFIRAKPDGTEVTKPDKDSLLAFSTRANTFIEAQAGDKRKYYYMHPAVDGLRTADEAKAQAKKDETARLKKKARDQAEAKERVKIREEARDKARELAKSNAVKAGQDPGSLEVLRRIRESGDRAYENACSDTARPKRVIDAGNKAEQAFDAAPPTSDIDKVGDKAAQDTEKLKPGPDRLKLYDLPLQWKSQHYWCRWGDADGAEAEVWEKMTDKKTGLDKPLIFSLDDVVFVKAKVEGPDKKLKLTPVDAAASDRPLLFYHTFAEATGGAGGRTGAKYSKIGVYKPGPDRKGAVQAAGDKAKAEAEAKEKKDARDKAEKAKRDEYLVPVRTNAENAKREEFKNAARQKAEEQARAARKNATEISQAGTQAYNGWTASVEEQKAVTKAGDDAVAAWKPDGGQQTAITQAGNTAEAGWNTDPAATGRVTTAETQAKTNAHLAEDAASGYPYSDIKLNGDKFNHVVDYPHWTRLIVFQGNLFDVFDQRSGQGLRPPDDAKFVIGARAAVNWVNAVTSADGGVGVAAATVHGARPAKPLPDPMRPYFAVQPFYQQEYFARSHARAAGTYDEWNNPIADGDGDLYQNARYEIAMLRCCDFEGTDERAVALRFHRFDFDFTAAPNTMDNATLGGDDTSRKVARSEWITKFVDACALRWTGEDGDNGDRAWVVPKAGNPALKTQVVTVVQHLAAARAHFKINLVAEDQTSAMNAEQGTGDLRVAAGADTVDRHFAGAHETGHCGGHPDEYCPYSYGQRGFGSNHVPGSPFEIEDDSMMNFNRWIRARYFWQVAEWMRLLPALKVDYKIEHGTESYELPHYQHDRRGRHWVSWPMRAKIDATLGGRRAAADTYLYRLGKDKFATSVLPGLLGGADYDGILVIMLRMRFFFGYAISDDKKKALFARLFSLIDNTLNYKRTAAFSIETGADAPPAFSRCLLYFSPRFGVGGQQSSTHLYVTVNQDANERVNWFDADATDPNQVDAYIANDSAGKLNDLGMKLAQHFIKALGMNLSAAPAAGSFSVPASYKEIVKTCMDGAAPDPVIS